MNPRVTYHASWCKSCLVEKYNRWKSRNPEKLKRYQQEYRKVFGYHTGTPRVKVQREEGYALKEAGKYRIKYPEKFNAQQTLNRNVRLGRIAKMPCAFCGAEKVHGHHPDYSKPLEVIWVCPIHHKQIHPGKQGRPPKHKLTTNSFPRR